MRADHRQTYTKACLSQRHSSFLHLSSKIPLENCSNIKVSLPPAALSTATEQLTHCVTNQWQKKKKHPLYENLCPCLAEHYCDERNISYFSKRPRYLQKHYDGCFACQSLSVCNMSLSVSHYNGHTHTHTHTHEEAKIEKINYKVCEEFGHLILRIFISGWIGHVTSLNISGCPL